MRAISAILILSAAALAAQPSAPASAGACETLSYGYVGYTEKGTRNFVTREVGRKISAWKEKHGAPGARVGKTSVTCKIFLKIGFFTEHECHARATVCR